MAAMAAMAAPALQRKPVGHAVPQAKLSVGAVGDRYEQEADRIASRIGSAAPTPAASPPPTISGLSAQRAPAPSKAGPEQKDDAVTAPEERAQRKAEGTSKKEPEKRGVAQRKSASPKKDDSKTKPAQRKAASPAKDSPKKKPAAQRKAAAPKKDDSKKKPVAQGDRTATPAVGAAGGEAPASVDASIQRMRGRSAPGLDPQTRTVVEDAVGSDLSGVRVHSDSAAAGAATDLNARAFTVGQDMFFGQGQFRPGTTEGQRLIAHEAAHTVQQRGGSPAARKIQRDEKPEGDGKTEADAGAEAPSPKKLKGKNWSLDLTPAEGATGGAITVPELKLPRIGKHLKGAANPDIGFTGAKLPVEGDHPFIRLPRDSRAERLTQAASTLWTKHMKENVSAAVQEVLKAQLDKQTDKAEVADSKDAQVYVLRSKITQSDFFIVGTLEELANNDALLRPAVSSKDGSLIFHHVDHILEDQLGGPDTHDNMWLLDSHYNMSVGSEIKSRINESIEETLTKARAEEKRRKATGPVFDGAIPRDASSVKHSMAVTFAKISAGKFNAGQPASYWAHDDIEHGRHLKYFKALNEKELFDQGFRFNKDAKPSRINVFPELSGGKRYSFGVKKDGKSLSTPDKFYRGVEITGDPVYTPLTEATLGGIIIELPIKYSKRKEKKKDSPIVSAKGTAKVKHDKRLGFGGYLTRESIRDMFVASDFRDASPMSFADAAISTEGELVARGTIASSKALLPGLQIPIQLRGSDVFIDFPIPTKSLNFGPVTVTDAAISLGVGDAGLFMEGSALILVKDIGQGSITARAQEGDVVIAGKMALDLDFLKPAELEATYSLAKDTFAAKGKFGVKKGALPGVQSGEVVITATRETFGVVGSLNLGGILSGSTITVGYTPETGLLIEGKDLPLPVEKLPGVSDAKVTVSARRNPETGEWSVSGGGKASLSAGPAKGSLDVLFDGEAVDFAGKVDVAKGPATGSLQITATNRAMDEEGNPVEGGPIGDLAIWGRGEATVAFGKVLTGKVAIEYTRDGRTILAGEIALPPTYALFDKKDLSPKEPLFEAKTPDFPIWGVKVGPVGIGIFGYGKVSVGATAYVGPGELRDAKLGVQNFDLDKPEDATVTGGAKFYLPAYAGLNMYLGGGLKAQVANAYAKGDVGIYGDLGLLLEGSFDVGVNWNATDGFAVAATAEIATTPKFEVGIQASVTVGVDLWLTEIDKTFGPWKKKLGEFGPDIKLIATFPAAWSEKDGLDISAEDVTIKPPNLDAKELMKGAFDMLV